MWHSKDDGATWNIVSDENFDEEGRDFGALFAAADDDTIVVGGVGTVVGENAEDGRLGAIDWTIGSDGVVERAIDTLDPGRNSVTTALVARPDGGFLTTTQLFDVGSAPTQPGQEPEGDPTVAAWSSPDGFDWIAETSSIPDIENAIVISGIGEFGGRVAFYGLESPSTAKAYIVDSATLK